MTDTHTHCGQQTFGSCPGETCERNCFERRNRTALEIVAENAAHDRRVLGAWALVIAIVLGLAGAWLCARQVKDNWRHYAVENSEA